MLVFQEGGGGGGGGNWREPGEKPSEQGDNQEPTNKLKQTWATLVGGESSHHCAIPASLNT